jgi:5-amino-6-(5-phosphoribosylamino)uracil reductase
VTDRPYTVLSCAISLDGYLDDEAPRRLVLSGPADLDRVDAVRAASDAILVGAATVRADNPCLVVRDPARRAARLAAGRPATPVKVTLTEHLKLDPEARFFTEGDGEKLVFCPTSRLDEARAAFAPQGIVVDGGEPVEVGTVVAALAARGVRRLMVEGGGTVLSQFLTAGIADELHLAVAPVFVGGGAAPRWAQDGRYPWSGGRRATLLGTRHLGDVVLLRYGLSERAVEEVPAR